jgi:hypothetical protein
MVTLPVIPVTDTAPPVPPDAMLLENNEFNKLKEFPTVLMDTAPPLNPADVDVKDESTNVTGPPIVNRERAPPLPVEDVDKNVTPVKDMDPVPVGTTLFA